MRILLFRALYLGPLFSETPTWRCNEYCSRRTVSQHHELLFRVFAAVVAAWAMMVMHALWADGTQDA